MGQRPVHEAQRVDEGGLDWNAYVAVLPYRVTDRGEPPPDDPDYLIPTADCDTNNGNGQSNRTLSSSSGGCSAAESGKVIGTGTAPYVFCATGILILPSDDQSLFGLDAQRSLSCTMDMTIAAAPALSTTALGSLVSVLAPGPGTMSIAPAGKTGVRRAVRRSSPTRASARARSAFAAQHMKVKQAGPVRFSLRLSKAAARTLKLRKKLALSVRETFAPTHGKTQSRTVHLTLRVLPGRPTVPKASTTRTSGTKTRTPGATTRHDSRRPA